MSFTLTTLTSLLVTSLTFCKTLLLIFGGKITEPGEIKYQVSIQNNGNHWCGGSIIDEQFILTAAHCLCDHNEFLNSIPFKVVAGINDTNSNVGKIEVDIFKVYIPAIYNQSDTSSPGDVAIIKLKQKLNLTVNSQLSKLELPPATSDRNREPSYAETEPLVTGFGWDQVNQLGNSTNKLENGSFSGKLLKAKTFVVDNIICQFLYNTIAIHHSQLCASVTQQPKEVPQGVCRGDSGGPLVLNNRVIGVVSFNLIGCNEQEKPTVCARVSSYINFIENAKKDEVTENMRSAIWS